MERIKIMIMLQRLRGLRPWTRHSAVLMVAGFMYAVTGVIYVVSETPEARRAALFIAYYWLSPQFWGYVFLTVGLMAMVSAKWPTFSQSWGYIALTTLSTGWAGVYFAGIFFVDTPSVNLTGSMVWSLFAFLWWAISGLSDPVKVVELNERD